jgi:hypothetical protein
MGRRRGLTRAGWGVRKGMWSEPRFACVDEIVQQEAQLLLCSNLLPVGRLPDQTRVSFVKIRGTCALGVVFVL